MKLRIFKEYDELSIAAADIFVQTGAAAIEARDRFLVALSGGSTPSGLYQLLASEPYRDQVNWEKTFVFWGDERCVPPDTDGSNYFHANEILLSHVPIPRENIQRVKGELVPYEASTDYAQTLKKFGDSKNAWPRFDLVLLGMGEDGHTASLFPGSQADFSSPTQAVTANYQGRPANRVTLTPLVFNSARRILFLVTGPKKATILSYVLSNEATDEQYPVQRIQPTEGQVTWLVDETAAARL
jgi:6-phosphogluconolactonase